MYLTGTIIDNRYEINSLFAEGGMSFLYRALDTRDGTTVAVKVLKPFTVSNRIEDVIRYRGAIEKISSLDNPYVARVIGTGNLAQAYGPPLHYIIMELVPAGNLHDMLAGGKSFSSDEAAETALQACRALDAVHRLGVIHGDVKPGNMLVADDGGVIRVKLIDFGLSRIKKYLESEYTGDTSGTFCYIPPEQAGIIRRGVDERSDLYSLGVVLYELLAGRLPYSGDSLVALLHQQAAKIPTAPSAYNNEVPNILDAIVLKLLAKEPGGRYQGAIGLMRDLERFLKGERDFIPGSDDAAVRIDFNAAMVGRDAELARLTALLDEARGGKGMLCLISGEAGIGKTRLADEFRKWVISLGIPYIEGRAFNRENKTPHGPLHDALTGYIRNFNRYGGKQREAITAALRKECGDMGRIVIDFNPQADVILGKCPDIVPLEPEREIQRFYNTMTRFFISLAKAENGLVIMLDDLQWSDMGTLKLMEELLRSIADAPLLAVGLFRHNEIGNNHPLRGMARGDAPVEEILVGHFNRERVASLVRSIVRMNENDTAILAEFITRKGGGNPLFSLEITKQLISEKLIAYDNGAWAITAQRLEETDIPETVINTLLKRTESLGKEDKELLSRAAVIGKIFDLDLLMRLEPADEENGASHEARMRTVIDAVDRAEKQQIVSRTQDEPGKISFIHDRVRDAFYGRIGADERKHLHRLTGVALENEHRDRTGDVVFDLAYHWIQAGDEDKILEFAHGAEVRARENYSYRDAIGYLEIIRSILKNWLSIRPGLEVSRRYLDYTILLAETNLDIFESTEALGLLNEVLPRLSEKDDLTNVYLLMTRAFIMEGNHKKSEESAARGLALLGEKIPSTGVVTIFAIIKTIVARLFYSMTGRLFSVARDTSGTIEKILHYFDWLWIAYAFTDAKKFAWLALRQLLLVERGIGSSRELEMCRMNYELVLAIILTRRRKRTVGLPPDEMDIPLYKRVFSSYYYIRGFLQFTYCDFPAAITDLKQGIAISEKMGDTFGNYWAGYILSLAHYFRSEYAEAQNAYDNALRNVKNVYEEMTMGSWAFPAEYYIETGRFKSALILFKGHLERLRELKMWSQYCNLNIDFAYLHLEKGEPEKALMRLTETRTIIRVHDLLLSWLTTYFPRYAQALIADFLQKRSSLSPRERRKSLRTIKKACRAAVWKTKRDRFISMVSIRTMAQYNILIEKNVRARRCFEESINIAQSVGRRYEEARSRYEYGIFLKNTGDSHTAWEQLVTASMIFDEIDVPVFRERIASHLGLGLEDGASLESRISREKTLHMIEKSHEFAACAELDGLLDRILSLTMEISGARCGHIFLYDDAAGKLEHAASHSIDETVWHDYSWNIVQEVLATGKPIMAADAASDANLSSYRSVSHLSLRSILCTPMEFNYMVSGVCYLDNHLAAGVFGDEEARLVALLLANASIAVENMLLRKRLDHGKAPAVPGRAKPRDENLRRVIAYLEEHFAEDITRGDLADIIGVHPDYLGKQFKGQTGKTIREYANELRIRWAMDLLNKTDEKIITIAFDAGFESLRTFNRIFFRTAGMTPAEYRGRKRKH